MNDMIAKQEGEKIKRENDSKIEWTRVNAKEVTTYDIDDIKNLRLKQLTEKVADLCDLQPTPASMVRPPRKEMLMELRGELAQALVDADDEAAVLDGRDAPLLGLELVEGGRCHKNRVADTPVHGVLEHERVVARARRLGERGKTDGSLTHVLWSNILGSVTANRC